MASVSQQSLDPTAQDHRRMGHYPQKMQHKFSCCAVQQAQSQGSKGIIMCHGGAGSFNCNPTSAKSFESLKMFGRTMGFVAAGCAAGITGGCLFQLAGLGGSGGGNNMGGCGGGGGGSGGGSPWSHWAEHFMALADSEYQESSYDPHGMKPGSKINVIKLNASKKYKISGVDLIDNGTGKPVGVDDPFHELITMKPGGVFTKAQFQTELENLSGCGMFERVDMDALPQVDGTLRMQIAFSESEWQPTEGLRCVNVGLMPQTKPPDVDITKLTDKEREMFMKSQEEEYKLRLKKARPCILARNVEKDISAWLRSERRVTARILQKIRDQVQKWYHDNGFACAQVVNFGNLNTKEIVCEVVEGDITKVIVQFQDKMGLPCEGNTNMQIVERELPEQLQAGFLFNIEAGKKALRSVNSLGLFSNIEVNPRPDEENDGGIVVEVKLKELEQKTAEVSTEWSIAPGGSGWPTLATIQPGGSVTFEHRNLQGLNRSLFGSVTSNNLLNPQDDLGFKMDYVHPYVDGVNDPRNRTFKASCFNSRKLSPVFTGGPGLDEVPAIWVDRAGLKANITESFTRQSKFMYGLVLEEITTRDETSAVCTNGARTLPNGALSMDGPPTSLSDTGIDRIGFLQANMTRDNTVFINRTPIGARYIFQVDQGLGIGTKYPIFNRHQLTLTQFLQLRKVEEGEKKAPPPVLVLHGRYGGCIGDLAAYDAFTLGGPYSVRGYNMGELGACRQFLELATELRVPILKTHTYGFLEYGTDLGSSKDVRGNPTEFFRRAGSGVSYGVGLKLGLVRAEYTQDCNTGSGSFFVRFGERF